MKKTYLLLTLLAQIHLFAQNPEAVTRDYFDFMRNGDWRGVASLHDPDSLGQIRELLSFLTEIPDEMSTDVIKQFFGSDATPESISQMSDQQYFAAFLFGIMQHIQQVGSLDFRKVEILGTVFENESLAHVVARTHIGIGEMSMVAMEVISLRKQEGEDWGVLMKAEIKGMAQQIRNMLEQHKRG